MGAEDVQIASPDVGGGDNNGQLKWQRMDSKGINDGRRRSMPILYRSMPDIFKEEDLKRNRNHQLSRRRSVPDLRSLANMQDGSPLRLSVLDKKFEKQRRKSLDVNDNIAAVLQSYQNDDDANINGQNAVS